MRAGCAILAAGGSRRLGEDKALADLGGHPVLAWSLAAVAASRVFERVVVVAPDTTGRISRAARELADCHVVSGGESRTASSWAALDALADVDVIAIHDAARPFAPPSLFTAVWKAALAEGAAAAGMPLAETVRRADEAGRSVEELARDGLWAAQTPQAFKRDILIRARQAAGDRTFTDDAAAVAAAGIAVRMIPGERRNLKITTLEDLAYARELVTQGLVAIAASASAREPRALREG